MQIRRTRTYFTKQNPSVGIQSFLFLYDLSGRGGGVVGYEPTTSNILDFMSTIVLHIPGSSGSEGELQKLNTLRERAFQS